MRKLLGIPTQSDAAARSRDYRNAVYLYGLQTRLNRFKLLFSTIYPQNHLVQAYHDTGTFRRFPGSLDAQDILPWRVPRKVQRQLDPNLVKGHYLVAAAGIRMVLDEARSHFIRHADVSVFDADGTFTGGPYPLVRLFGLSEPRPGWRYVFPVYDVAMGVVNDFTRTIQEFYLESGKNPAEKILNMLGHADETARSLNVRLVSSALVIDDARSRFGYEDSPLHIAGQLRKQHHELADASDVYLSFDETTFHVNTQANLQRSIRATCILDSDHRMRYDRLAARYSLRESIRAIADHKHHLVINGTYYEPRQLSVAGQQQSGYIVDGESHQAIANLLGAPVLPTHADVITPEPWVRAEMTLIDEFLKRGSSAAAQKLLSLYDLDSSSGHPSDQRALHTLRHALQV